MPVLNKYRKLERWGLEGLLPVVFVLFLWSSPVFSSGEFEDLGNGVVFQKSTGLYWQQGDEGVRRDWCSARIRCEQLKTGGFDDWRLPSDKELSRMTEERLVEVLEKGRGTLNPVFHNFYWTSIYRSLDRYHEGPLTVHGTNSEVVMASLSDKKHTRCVRGKVVDVMGDFTISTFAADSYSGMSPFEPKFYVSVEDQCGLPRGTGPYRFEFDFGNGRVKTVDGEQGNAVVKGFFQTTGEYEVKVVVSDSAGKSIKATVKVTADSDMSSPLAGISLPQEGAVLKEIAHVIAQVQDETSVKEVKVYVDGKSVGFMKETNRNIYEFRINTYSLKNGKHKITVKALNSLGLLSSSSINVVTDNN